MLISKWEVVLGDILTEFEVNLGIIIEKYAKTWSFPMH